MEASIGKEKDRPDTYFLSPEDFNKPPEEIKPYRFPEKVSRDNFANWFIQSFSISRGEIYNQALWMKYIDNKTGFDSRKSLLAFEDAGGLSNALTSEEKGIFVDMFSRVKRHEKEEADLDGEAYEETFRLLVDSLLDLEEDIISNSVSLSPPDFLSQIRKNKAVFE